MLSVLNIVHSVSIVVHSVPIVAHSVPIVAHSVVRSLVSSPLIWAVWCAPHTLA